MLNISKQKGFSTILLVIVLILISGGAILFYLNNSRTIKIFNKDTESLNLSSDELLSIKAPIKTVAPKTKKISGCQNEVDLWQYLPEDLEKKTFKEGINPARKSTYDIFPLAWSKDCLKQAFLLELVGRGAEAYTPKDFLPRGLYIFNNKTQQVKFVYPIPIEFNLDEKVYGSNYWTTEDKYIFVLSTNEEKEEFLSRRYEYDEKLEKVQLYGE